MKNLRQKLLISLVLVMCLFLGRSYASQTINVINWNPWGILKLNQIILKTGTNATGIILNGNSSNAYIQIARWNTTATSGIFLSGITSTISVNRICDANGNNCRNVANILTGNGGGGGGGGYWQVNNGVITTSGGNYRLALLSGLSVTGTTNLHNKLLVPGAANSPVLINAIGFMVTGSTILNNNLTVKGVTTMNNILKVQSEDNSVIWVDTICDQNGTSTSCIDVSDLGTGGGGGGGGYWRKSSNTLYTSGGDYSIAVKNLTTSGTATLKTLVVNNPQGSNKNVELKGTGDHSVFYNQWGFTVFKDWMYITSGRLVLTNSDLRMDGGSVYVTGNTTINGVTTIKNKLKVQSTNNSEIWVDTICDQNGSSSSCIDVSDLGAGGGGGDNLFKYVSSTAKIYTSGDRHFIVTGGQIRTKELFVTTNGLKVTGDTTLYSPNGSRYLQLTNNGFTLSGTKNFMGGNVNIQGTTTITGQLNVSERSQFKKGLSVIGGKITSSSGINITSGGLQVSTRKHGAIINGTDYTDQGHYNRYFSHIQLKSQYPGDRRLTEIAGFNNDDDTPYMKYYVPCNLENEGTITYYRTYEGTTRSYGQFQGCICTINYGTNSSYSPNKYKCAWEPLSDQYFDRSEAANSSNGWSSF